MLSHYRQAIRHAGPRQVNRLTTLVGAAYFSVWTLCGMAAFPLGLALAEATMRVPALSRLVPIARGVVVLVAGLLQLTAWRARQLACCRAAPEHVLTADADTALRHGTRLGIHCVLCCLGLTSVLLVTGVMDLRAMALVASAITAERLAFSGVQVARGIGGVIVAAGLFMITLGSGLLGN
jgi:predicted metal-binding membrane protein